jgi:hypothetical protein
MARPPARCEYCWMFRHVSRNTLRSIKVHFDKLYDRQKLSKHVKRPQLIAVETRCTHTHTHTNTCARTHARTHTHAHAHVHTNTHTHTYTYTYTYTHTHTHSALTVPMCAWPGVAKEAGKAEMLAPSSNSCRQHFGRGTRHLLYSQVPITHPILRMNEDEPVMKHVLNIFTIGMI